MIFSSEGMHLGDSGEVIPYGDFEFFIEGTDVYLITFTGRVVLLQKKDLQQEETAFAAFIAEHTVLTKSI
ncbi:MAG: YcxB family protein [Oscillospiraceae bacterium]|nr:YcxB family protein [Oscillospiraceae bacterium]